MPERYSDDAEDDQFKERTDTLSPLKKVELKPRSSARDLAESRFQDKVRKKLEPYGVKIIRIDSLEKEGEITDLSFAITGHVQTNISLSELFEAVTEQKSHKARFGEDRSDLEEKVAKARGKLEESLGTTLNNHNYKELIAPKDVVAEALGIELPKVKKSVMAR